MSISGFTLRLRQRSLSSSQWVLALLLSLGGVVAMPGLSDAALAQAVSEDDLQNYARSLLAIEPVRQSAYNEIKRILGSDEVPRIDCHRPDSLNSLNANIRQIAIDYCEDARNIALRYSLTPDEFNAITRALQTNPALVPRIEQEMIRIQQGNNR